MAHESVENPEPPPGWGATVASGATVRVLVVDKAVMWRAIVRDALAVGGIEIVGEAASADATVRLATELRPDVILLDTRVIRDADRDLVRELAACRPAPLVVLFSDRANHGEVVQALSDGAHGYLTKDVSQAALVRAILGTANGDLPMSRGMAATALRHFVRALSDTQPAPADDLALTAREVQVLAELAAGRTDRQIADDLHLSIRTVESHVTHVLRKLGVRNRTEAARRFLASPKRTAAPEDRAAASTLRR